MVRFIYVWAGAIRQWMVHYVVSGLRGRSGTRDRPDVYLCAAADGAVALSGTEGLHGEVGRGKAGGAGGTDWVGRPVEVQEVGVCLQSSWGSTRTGERGRELAARTWDGVGTRDGRRAR